MKIAHVVWGMKTGGVETMLVNIINEQVKTEEVRLFIINDFIDEFIVKKISPLCKVQRLNRKPGDKNLLKIVKLNCWICNYCPDIIHVHSYRVSKLIFGRWKIVRTIHGMDNIPQEYGRMKALFSISNTVAEFTKSQGYNSIVIPNGIDVRKIKTKGSKAFNDNQIHVVQVSRLYIKEKGQDLLLKALHRVVYDFDIHGIRLHLIGEGDSESLLKKMVTDLQLDDFVIFEGLKSQDYIYNHLCDYDLFVQPSRQEGFGLTVAEALAAKLPVLVSDIEGPMEIIGYGKFGMHFKSEDVDDLAEKLRMVLQGGYDYTLVEKAYQHVCEDYDVANTARKYIEEYRRLI